jgi:hypothetical protein
MKLKTLFATLGLLAVHANAQSPADPYMGDWQGSVTLGDQKQTVAVYMIPLDDGRYEGRFVADFSRRGPYLYRLRGQIRNGQLRFMDDIPLDASQIVETTAKGVVFGASLWTGSLGGEVAGGSVAGRQTGSFELHKTQRISPTLGQHAPGDAVVLLDGSNLDQWQTRNGQPCGWKLLPGGAMEVGKGGDAVSKEKFGDHQLHLEFRLAYMPRASGQGRSNSGVYLQTRYECQVLDSYGLEGLDNECGGFYQICQPRVNMCAPPLQWQSYDITFHMAKIGANGKKTANARVTVVHNGVVIHDNFELPHPTPGGMDNKEGTAAPLLLQDHGNPVQYRNIWVKRL